MLTVRKEQMEALDRDKRKRFVNHMAEHLQKFFPKKCASLGDKQVREWIEHGIDRAQSYRIISERDVCKYLDVMFVFGKNFDCDAQLPWAAKILNLQYADPSGKVSQLFQAARENMSHVGEFNG